MAQIYVKYNPYKMETQIKANGKDILSDSSLYKVVKGKRLQEWVGKFPQMLVDELNTVDFDIEFYGMPLDWDDFEDSFTHAKDEHGTQLSTNDDGKVIFPINTDEIESFIPGIEREGESFTHEKKSIGLETNSGKAESILVASEGYFG